MKRWVFSHPAVVPQGSTIGCIVLPYLGQHWLSCWLQMESFLEINEDLFRALFMCWSLCLKRQEYQALLGVIHLLRGSKFICKTTIKQLNYERNNRTWYSSMFGCYLNYLKICPNYSIMKWTPVAFLRYFPTFYWVKKFYQDVQQDKKKWWQDKGGWFQTKRWEI